MNNFYELLGVSFDASAAEINEAYQNKVAELYVLKSTGALDDDLFDTKLNNLVKACSVLTDDKVRKEYDEYLANKNNSNKRNGSKQGKRVASKSKKGIVKKVATGAVCVALAASVIVTGIFGAKKIKDFLGNRNSKQETEQSQVIDSGVTPSNISSAETRAKKIVQQLNNAGLVNEETSEPYTVEEVKNVIEYIDASYEPNETVNTSEKEILEGKATNIAQQLREAGLNNVNTNQPYTTDEIKDIIQYIDGVYDLEDEEAINIVYDFLNIVVTPINNLKSDSQTNDNSDIQYPGLRNYGDIMDDALVLERATTLVNELKAFNVVNPVTCVPYTIDECVALIKYANGVYVPSTMEEIDVLHLNLLNLLISPLNTDEYLYHVVYASGNDDFKDIAVEAANNVKPINFAGAFAEYGENGVYPLTKWMQEQREAIYSTTDRDEINRIYVEVGQVMADIMKGNGCTITVIEDNVERTYTFTSEQILANHASAMLLTIDAQLIFANHYEVRDEKDRIVASSQSVWQVYNKFNGEEPDQVSLDEIQAWINNGCEYEWGIEDVLIGGQTFGQRIQGDMEGLAQNNYAKHSGNTLGK